MTEKNYIATTDGTGLEGVVERSETDRKETILFKRMLPWLLAGSLAVGGIHLYETYTEQKTAYRNRIADLEEQIYQLEEAKCAEENTVRAPDRIVGMDATDSALVTSMKYNADINASYLIHYAQQYAPIARKLDENSLITLALANAAKETDMLDINPLTGKKTVSWTGYFGLAQPPGHTNKLACADDANKILQRTNQKECQPIDVNLLKDNSIAGVREQARLAVLYHIFNSERVGSDIEKLAVAYNMGPNALKEIVNEYGDDWKNNLGWQAKSHLKTVSSYITEIQKASTVSGMKDNVLTILGTAYETGRESPYIVSQVWRTEQINKSQLLAILNPEPSSNI